MEVIPHQIRSINRGPINSEFFIRSGSYVHLWYFLILPFLSQSIMLFVLMVLLKWNTVRGLVSQHPTLVEGHRRNKVNRVVIVVLACAFTQIKLCPAPLHSAGTTATSFFGHQSNISSGTSSTRKRQVNTFVPKDS